MFLIIIFFEKTGTGDYAIRDTDLNVKIFKQFKDTGITFKPTEIDAEQLWGGSLIAIKSNDAVAFYDWETGYYIQRIDVRIKNFQKFEKFHKFHKFHKL